MINDGIVSLTFGHFLLNKVREKNEKHREDLHIKVQKKKQKKKCMNF